MKQEKWMYVVPFLFFIFLSVRTEAGCTQNQVQCNPVISNADGTRQYQWFDLDFSTRNQSIFFPGGASSLEYDINLVKSSDATFGIKNKGFSEIHTYCLHDYISSYFGSTVANIFKKVFGNRCYSYGGKASATIEASVFAKLGLKATTGYADVDYPVQVQLEMPDKDAYNPGDVIEINTHLAARSGVDVSAILPNWGVKVAVGGKADGDTSATGCLDSCKRLTLLDFNVSGSGEAWLPAELVMDNNFNPSAESTLGFLLGATGRIGLPYITSGDVIRNGNEVTVIGEDEFVKVDINLEEWLSRFVKVGGKILKRVVFKSFAFMTARAFDVITSIRSTLTQKTVFDPEFILDIAWDADMQWEERTSGGSLVETGFGRQHTMPVGHKLRLFTSTTAVTPVHLNVTAYQDNDFYIDTRVTNESWLDVGLFKTDVGIPEWTIFSKRCEGPWCLPKKIWSAVTYHKGPAFEQNKLGYVEYDYHLFTTPTKSLGGFQTFPLAPMTLDPNLPPEVVAIPAQFQHWGQNYDLDLNAYFSDPDGHALSYSVTGLPPYLSLTANGHIQGQVDQLFDGMVTITADDGHGRQVSTSTRMAVAMPVVDILDGLSVEEGGATDTFTVKLSIQPQQNVTVHITPQNDEVDIGGGLGNVHSLTFTPQNWDQPQSVTIIADDDLIDEDPPELSTVFVMDSSSADTPFDAMTAPDFQTRVVDDDVAGIVATPASGIVFSENGGGASFGVKLNSEPTADVTVTLTCRFVPCRANFTPATLTFTPLNWNLLQQVTVTAIDNNVADGSHPLYMDYASPSSADPIYDRIPSLTVGTPLFQAEMADDDTSGITISPDTGILTGENGLTATVSVVLNSKPQCAFAIQAKYSQANAKNSEENSGERRNVAQGQCLVTLDIASTNASEAILGTTQLVFHENNWNIPQSFQVNGLDDELDDGDQPFELTVTVTAPIEQTGYASMTVPNLLGSNQDDDNSLIEVTPQTAGQTREDGTLNASYSVRLTAKPLQDITVSATSLATDEGQPAMASMTFTPSDWNSPQTLEIYGVDDQIVDGPQPYTVRLAASGDSNYSAAPAVDLSLENQDNDLPGLTAIIQGSADLAEAGGQVDFIVTLDRQPQTNVIVGVASADDSEARTSVSQLLFTPSNWNSGQVLTVLAQDDPEHDGNQSVIIRLLPVDDNVPGYGGFDPADLQVNVLDDDQVGITMGPVSSSTVTEPDGTAMFEIRLTSRPTAPVEIPLVLSPAGIGQINGDRVLFLPESWDQPRIVSVSALDDDIADGDKSFSVITSPSVSSDPDYQGIDIADVDLTRLDDDQPGVLISPVTGLATAEDGSQAQFQVVLASQPTAPVTLGLHVSDSGEGSVFPTSITIPPQDWDQPVIVTVTGQDDPFVDGDKEYMVVTDTVSSADAGYQGIDPEDVMVRNADDENPSLILSKTALVTSETGSSANFDVTLGARPVGDVKLMIHVGDESEGSVQPQTLSFNASNWNKAQTVNVIGQNDIEGDGDQVYDITVVPAADSPDVNFSRMHGYVVQVTNKDDGDPIVRVEPVTGLMTTEAGSRARFSVAVDRAPVAGTQVSISLGTSDAGEAIASIPNLVFTPDNWDQPHQVEVIGVNDNLDDGDQTVTIILGKVISTDAHFAGYKPSDVSVINRDNDIDSDEDGVTDLLEGDTDRDGDQIVDRLDYDPTGYFYNSDSGEIIAGGQVQISCDKGTVTFVSGLDGASGFYQYIVEGIPANQIATCTQTFNPPPGYMPDVNCTSQGALDVPDGPLPIVLGSDENGNTGILNRAACADNPYYAVLKVETNDAPIFSNNIAVAKEQTVNIPVPMRGHWSWLILVLLVLSSGYWYVYRGTKRV